MFEYRKGILFWHDFDLSTLAEQFSSPLHVIHPEAAKQSIDSFLTPFNKENLPVVCHYSVKTNPIPELLLLFKQHNIKMEVISEYEMWLVEQLGFQGEDIIINGTGKRKELLSFACRQKAKLISIWSVNDFRRCEEISFEESEPLNVGVRICPSFSLRFSTLSLNSAGKNSPHGFFAKEADLKKILQKIKYNHNLKFKGFHIHLGSGINKSQPYIKALSVIEELIIDTGKFGLNSRIINIGGGFCSGSAPLYSLPQLFSMFFMKKKSERNEKAKSVILEPLAKELSRCLARLNKQGHIIDEVITEPGRIFSGSSQLTILTVLDIIKRQNSKPALICDGGAMSLSPMLLTEFHRIFPLIKKGDKVRQYSVYGNLPSSLDMVAGSVTLPGIEIGDQLAVLDTGAYFIPFSNNFAGPRPAIVMIEGKHSKLIRKKESINDLFRLDEYFKIKSERISLMSRSRKIDLTPTKENIKKVQYLQVGQQLWSALAVKERVKRINKLRKVIANHAEEIARAVSNECVRPMTEALAQEVLPVLEMSKYCEKQFPHWLKDEKIRYWRPGFSRKQNIFVKQAIGSIGVITPGNFPFTLGMMSLIYLMMAGNTVILKPSEYSQTVAPLIRDLLEEAELLPDFANLITGGKEIGKWLVTQPEIKKIIFFGRQKNGLSILKACSQSFKSCVLELGGGSTAIVAKDANLNLAASGIVWSGFYANGQSCIGTDRVLIEKEIAPEFTDLLLSKVAYFQSEIFENQNHKHIMKDSEILKLMQLIKMAKNEGCEVLCGGNHIQRSEKKLAFEFTIISAPDTRVKIFKEELFGPMIVICPVENLAVATAEINSVFPSLGVSIWKTSRRETINIAKNIHASMIWVNDTSFGLPCLPWFGAGNTGWGKIFSKYSLNEIVQEKWISYHPAKFARERLWWNPYSKFKEKLFLFGANKILRK